jgi:hypothetical protein
MKISFCALVTSISRCVAIPSIMLSGFAVVLLAPTPASAASRGEEASCSFTSATRLQCGFPVVSAAFNAEIHYVTVQCNSTGASGYNLQEFQILATPVTGSATAIPYQVAGNRASVGGVVNAGAIVDIHVLVNTAPSAVIDLAPAPTGTTSCTVSMTVIF